MDSNLSLDDIEKARHISADWDCSLHLPLWVSNIEGASIENQLEDWTRKLEECGADIDLVASVMKKPLRPLWISQKTVIWLNEVPDYDSWDFTPFILVSASASHGFIQQRRTSEFSWHYIPGAGDDEESWARGLHPRLFWKHAYDVIDLGPSMCNQKVSEIVEKERVYLSQRCSASPQVTVRTQKELANDGFVSGSESCVPVEIEHLVTYVSTKSSNDECFIYWIGSTNLAVGSSIDALNLRVDACCILNCDPNFMSSCFTTYDSCLHLPIMSSKLDRFSLMNSLSLAVRFAELSMKREKKLLICCHDGEDISICVCLAIFARLFDEEGYFDGGKASMSTSITKLDLRRQLVFICKFAIKARPSRGNLKQVFGFLSRERRFICSGASSVSGESTSEFKN
ncbi:tRNA A64-2'-O-ribosylphosphate transferase [Apostasia shenzhenica]|uniref:tRNA A64-2'-O-ribosylphosphate transferase n=1 Tax=Apostasia shenzhenica TaxID=1088818 RepID=A0A2I0BA20_9ASPA|nr:tRNA A64-2'-O-ribosylphosphate transferase [Apostasia shenzhenica]